MGKEHIQTIIFKIRVFPYRYLDLCLSLAPLQCHKLPPFHHACAYRDKVPGYPA